MGYIGLLLNAPYKIDSMMWMSLMMMCSVSHVNEGLSFWSGLWKPGGILVKGS
jgi:hypothetical protein